MNKKKRKKLSALILLLAITVGYALLSTTLRINGVANIKSNTWDIHFEHVVPNNESTITAETPSITDNATKVSYEVTLELPGDFYEFTVDAVNDGSINGEITKLDHKVYLSTDLENPISGLPSYIKYSIVYDGTTDEPQEGDLLEAGDTKTYRIRIEFDPEATTLPNTDTTYKIVDEITYTQTKKRNRSVEDIIDEIEANPDSYRNSSQSVANRDIGLDENGNVINLDMWVGIDTGEYERGSCEGTKYYYKKSGSNEAKLGVDDCFTPATSAAQIVNGEVITPIPAYIMFAGDSKFIPVTEIGYAFGNDNDVDRRITKMPHLPNTIKKLEGGFIWKQPIQEVTIPNHIEIIDGYSFNLCTISTLNFEANSKLREIGDAAFCDNNLSGDLVLPQTVGKIGNNTFKNNNLTSVTFSSTTQYSTNCTNHGESCNSFDNGVTINHNY